MRIRLRETISTIFALAVAVPAMFHAAPARAANTLTPLCAFGASTCGGSPAGYGPVAGLIRDSSGNLYGTAKFGGAHNGGAVYMISPGGAYTELYPFCSASGCTDGQTPLGSLIMDTSGNLYGTTSDGGPSHSGTDGGVVFKLSPPSGGGTPWNEAILHRFCSPATCIGTGTTVAFDGAGPTSGLAYAGQASGALYDGTSPLYGTTRVGGNTASASPLLIGWGTVFKLTLSSGIWSETKLVDFCNCTGDGGQPWSRVIVDGSGNLYGTARGGTTGGGVVYEVSSGGAYSVIYNFCQIAGGAGQPYCLDGQSPDTTGVLMDASGDLYGSTVSGGTSTHLSVNGGGVVYKLHNGVGCPFGFWCETVLRSFCKQTGCTDGATPSEGDGVLMDSSGNIFGTAEAYGNGVGIGSVDGGVFYKIDAGTLAYHRLYSFCKTVNCSMDPPDGNYPLGGLTMDSSGNFYGTTQRGGSAGFGLVYQFTP